MAHKPTSSNKRKKRAKLLEQLEQRTLMAAPLVITKGGTYTGTWESTNRSTPAVTVNTSEPVTIFPSGPCNSTL